MAIIGIRLQKSCNILRVNLICRVYGISSILADIIYKKGMGLAVFTVRETEQQTS
jgi:hypothetical protein